MKALVIKPSATIRQRVHKYIREKILTGAIAPGERLVETAIANEIGASRTPVREALHALEREGLIESRSRVGYVTTLVTEDELDEICEIRSAIETIAASRTLKRARTKVLNELARNISVAEERLAQGKVRDFIDLDTRFHEIIMKCSGSSRLVELAESLRGQMLRYRSQSIYVPDNVVEAIEGHKRILAAIEADDVKLLNESIRRHLQESKDAIIRYAHLAGR